MTGPAFAETLRGWIRPRIPVADFLESYSRLGGTHHSALLVGGQLRTNWALRAFADSMGFQYVRIA